MPTYKTQGIIIRRKNFGEADRLLTIYTKNHGKIRAVAKGARKPLSKLGGHLELFYLVDLMLAEGKSLDIITSVQLINRHKRLRGNQGLVKLAYYFAELIDLATKEELSSPGLFNLALGVFKNISQDEKLLRYFELKLVCILGHAPEVSACVVCRKRLEYNYHDFSYLRGGVVCSNCTKGPIKKISPETIKLMRTIIGQNWGFISHLKIHQNILSELEKINQEILEHIIEKEIKSRKFL